MKTTEKNSVVLYQVTKKAGKVAKIQASTVEELVSALYRGLKLQEKIGKRFLKLGAGTEVHIPNGNTLYIDLQKVNAKNFNEAQMLAVFTALNK